MASRTAFWCSSPASSPRCGRRGPCCGCRALAVLLIGILFCSILFDRIQLGWFLYLIAAQALATAYAEFTMARHTAKEHGSRWNYAAASIALLCAVSYLVAGICAPANLTPHDIAMLAYAYLAAFGVAQSLMAGRMLAFEHRAPHSDPRGWSIDTTSCDVCDVRHGQLPLMHSLIVSRLVPK